MAARLTPLSQILLPPPRPDETYRGAGADGPIDFVGLKSLLGAADFPKAGDRHAGLAAADDIAREATRTIVAGLTVAHVHERPLLTGDGRIDDVMRVNYDVDGAVYREIAPLTFGQLKDRLRACPGAEAVRLGRGLTGVTAAAVAKLCDIHELILVARRIANRSRARTLLGAPGTLSSRLQPNHPTDHPRGIALLSWWGLSMAAGDALIGVNPAIDPVDNVAAVLHLLDDLRRRAGAPTQICVLSHVKTQLAALDRGVPVEILFQSLAGTEATLVAEFDVTVDLLDEGWRTMQRRGPLRAAPQSMYFETGQGSQFSYGRHEGIDMTTTEALCHGLARRYDPFMINNVTGFIGPETHRDNFELLAASLQDLFLGKLLGLPMGIGSCYTLHAESGLEGQQATTELLAAANATSFMDVALNTDRMLAYFDTSAHDNQTLREIHGREPAGEFLAWCLARGILARDGAGAVVRGPAWGRPELFCGSAEEFEELVAATSALHGFEHAGPRPADSVARRVRWHQAVGRAAVHLPLDLDRLQDVARFREIATAAGTHDEHLAHPALGARPAAEALEGLAAEPFPVQILVSDGLSAAAVHHNLPDLLPLLLDGLAARGIGVGVPLAARHGRVKLAEPVGERLGADVVIHLIGERPGGDARASRSLSAYLVYRVPEAVRPAAARASGNAAIRHEVTVISNIYAAGLPPVEAAAQIVEKTERILRHRAAGNRLEGIVAAAGAGRGHDRCRRVASVVDRRSVALAMRRRSHVGRLTNDGW
jgi:ethanolamine ammonia-lyase large subunit